MPDSLDKKAADIWRSSVFIVLETLNFDTTFAVQTRAMRDTYFEQKERAESLLAALPEVIAFRASACCQKSQLGEATHVEQYSSPSNAGPEAVGTTHVSAAKKSVKEDLGTVKEEEEGGTAKKEDNRILDSNYLSVTLLADQPAVKRRKLSSGRLTLQPCNCAPSELAAVVAGSNMKDTCRYVCKLGDHRVHCCV